MSGQVQTGHVASSAAGYEVIDVEEFDKVPYLNILTYPRHDLRLAKSRMRQLRELGVKKVAFEGRTKIGRLGLIGLGTVGVVVRAVGEDASSSFALKIRRVDANRASMREEFRLTQLANRVGVGALAYGATKDLMIMQHVRGKELEQYVRDVTGKGRAKRVRAMAHALLNQCRKLDLIGLDHGQISDLRKHVIIESDIPCIIDFESASQGRAPKNVTTAAQYLFLGSRLSPVMKRILSIEDPGEILEALRRYKRDMSDENYVRVLGTFGVTT